MLPLLLSQITTWGSREQSGIKNSKAIQCNELIDNNPKRFKNATNCNISSELNALPWQQFNFKWFWNITQLHPWKRLSCATRHRRQTECETSLNPVSQHDTFPTRKRQSWEREKNSKEVGRRKPTHRQQRHILSTALVLFGQSISTYVF